MSDPRPRQPSMRQAMIARLRELHLEDDAAFDAMYPDWAQRVSRGNWSSLEVARRAAELLVDEPGRRVLDVGSGVGKLCIVGALTTGGHFHGVEQRAHFVAAARAAATRLDVPRVKFTCANMSEIDWQPYASLYLFNPFAEYLGKLLDPFDKTVAVDEALATVYVRHVVEQLERASVGTRVVTYAGFGGEFPQSYRIESSEPAGSDRLDLWLKVR